MTTPARCNATVDLTHPWRRTTYAPGQQAGLVFRCSACGTQHVFSGQFRTGLTTIRCGAVLVFCGCT